MPAFSELTRLVSILKVSCSCLTLALLMWLDSNMSPTIVLTEHFFRAQNSQAKRHEDAHSSLKSPDRVIFEFHLSLSKESLLGSTQ